MITDTAATTPAHPHHSHASAGAPRRSVAAPRRPARRVRCTARRPHTGPQPAALVSPARRPEREQLSYFLFRISLRKHSPGTKE